MSLIMSQADLLSREKSGIFSFCCARAEPNHVAPAMRARIPQAATLTLSSAESRVAFAKFASDMVTSLAQSGAA